MRFRVHSEFRYLSEWGREQEVLSRERLDRSNRSRRRTARAPPRSVQAVRERLAFSIVGNRMTGRSVTVPGNLRGTTLPTGARARAEPGVETGSFRRVRFCGADLPRACGCAELELLRTRSAHLVREVKVHGRWRSTAAPPRSTRRAFPHPKGPPLEGEGRGLFVFFLLLLFGHPTITRLDRVSSPNCS